MPRCNAGNAHNFVFITVANDLPINDAPDNRPVGLECRKCGCRHFYVIRTSKRDHKIVRVRECRHCGAKITTFEREAS